MFYKIYCTPLKFAVINNKATITAVASHYHYNGFKTASHIYSSKTHKLIPAVLSIRFLRIFSQFKGDSGKGQLLWFRADCGKGGYENGGEFEGGRSISGGS